MQSIETFEQNLREMLLHLYDPVYRPPESLRQVLKIPREQGVEAVRDAVLAGIEALKPSERVPPTARAWRIYGMLRYRFAEDLSQEMAAERLGITARHLRREIVEAVHALALYLWEKHSEAQPAEDLPAGEPPQASDPAAAAQNPAEANASWQAQLRRELESLQETASGSAANLAETVAGVLRLGAHLTEPRGVKLAGSISEDLTAAVHPSALRQILISIIDRLSQAMHGGQITISAEPLDGTLRLDLTASPALAVPLSELAFVREFLSDQEGSFQIHRDGSSTRVSLELLAVDRCVLVVDDNPDIVHLYRRYLAGTRYFIQHISHGLEIRQAIETYHPAVIVLDVMLPDVDGWDLLTRLHEDPTTRSLPVIICSVMREKDLALALGARHFIAKPVQRADFIAALDMALAPA